jgi:hypothetical protein
MNILSALGPSSTGQESELSPSKADEQKERKSEGGMRHVEDP